MCIDLENEYSHLLAESNDIMSTNRRDLDILLAYCERWIQMHIITIAKNKDSDSEVRFSTYMLYTVQRWAEDNDKNKMIKKKWIQLYKQMR